MGKSDYDESARYPGSALSGIFFITKLVKTFWWTKNTFNLGNSETNYHTELLQATLRLIIKCHEFTVAEVQPCLASV